MAAGPNEQSSAQEWPTLWRNFSFHILWSSTFASGIADRLAIMAAQAVLGVGAAKEILPRVDAASVAAGVELFFWMSFVILGPIAGWIADRVSRKWIMFVCDQVRGIVVLCALFFVGQGQTYTGDIYDVWFTIPGIGIEATHAWKVWFFMFAIGFCVASFNPARTSIIPSVVGEKWLQAGNAIALSCGVIGSLIGFLIAGVMAERFMQIMIITAGVAYMASGLFWAFLSAPYQKHQEQVREHKKPLQEIADGVRYIMSHRGIKSLTLVSIVFWAGSSVFMSAVAYITTEQLIIDPNQISEFQAYTFVLGLFGLGILLGALVVGAMNSKYGGELLLAFGMLGAAVSMLIFINLTNVWLAMVMSVISGFFGGIFMITINVMYQMLVSNKVLGRVVGARDMVGEITRLIVLMVIFLNPAANQYMEYAVWALCALLLFMSLSGIRNYVVVGPHDSKLCNFGMRLIGLYTSSYHRLTMKGKHYIPHTGGTVLLANHTCSIDPLLMQLGTGRTIRWMMATEYRLGIFAPFWKRINPISVPRTGGSEDSTVAKQAIRALKDGDILGLFPEGQLNLERDKLIDFKSGIGLIAKRGHAAIVPTFISGTPMTDNVLFGFLRPSKSRVVFGKPFTYEEIESQLKAEGIAKPSVAEVTVKMQERVEALRGE